MWWFYTCAFVNILKTHNPLAVVIDLDDDNVDATITGLSPTTTFKILGV